HTFERSMEFDTSIRRDELTGLPPLSELERVILPTSVSAEGSNSFSLLFIDVANLKEINVTYGRTAGDETLQHVVRCTRSGLRVADILFRNTSDELVALLNDTDASTADFVAERVRNNVTSQAVSLSSGYQILVNVTVRSVCFPRDGRTLADLLSVARGRVQSA